MVGVIAELHRAITCTVHTARGCEVALCFPVYAYVACILPCIAFESRRKHTRSASPTAVKNARGFTAAINIVMKAYTKAEARSVRKHEY